MRIKAALFLVLSVLLLTTLATAQEAMAPDPGIPDTLRINDATGNAGGKAVVDVYFYNDEELAGLTMPLKWSSSAITLDSVSWVGSRASYVGFKTVTINNAARNVNIGAVIFFESYLQPGVGLGCKLYFDIPAGTPDQVVTIDSTFIAPAARDEFTLKTGSNFAVQINSGMLTIGNPRPTIGVSPTNFAFNGTEGGVNPSNQILNISNTGTGTLNWTATKTASWLGITPTSGTNAGAVTASINLTGLTAGTYNDTIRVTDAAATNSPVKVPVTLVVAPPPKPTIQLSPTTFTFNATEGGGNPISQTLTITNVGASTLNWTATKSSLWLGLDPASGAGNGTSAVSVNIAGLAPATYTDTIVVTDPNATNSPQKAVVTLVVAAAPKPTIALSPGVFTFNAVEGGANPVNQTLNITNSGAATLNWTATKSSLWLGLDPSSGSGNTAVSLSVNIAGLTPATYKDTIVVTDPNATNSPQKAVVTLVVTAAPKPTISLSPGSFTFNAVEGAGNPGTKILNITNSGAATLNWTATKSSLWLGLSPSSGAGNTAVTVSVDITGMAAGAYTDTIVVTDPNATNSPQRAPVNLIIVAPPKPSIFLNPTTFTFNAVEGGGNPVDQELQIRSIETGILHWTATKSSAWLGLNPTSGTGDANVIVSVNSTGLTPATYVDTIVVSDPGAGNSPQKAVVTLVVSAVPKPTIAVAPEWLNFTATEGGAKPEAQTFEITNVGGGTLNWTLTKIANWLSLSATSGTGDTTIGVTITDDTLPAGFYMDTIFVSDLNATNSPQYAVVTLEVTPGLHDSVFVSHVTTNPGGHAVVDITYRNFGLTGALNLPLYFLGAGVICDSVSWVGSRCEYMDTRIALINNDEWTIVIAAVAMTEPPLGPGDGLLARLYFSIDPAATPKVVPIDTGLVLPSYEFDFVNEIGRPIPTEFSAGSITITDETLPCFSFPVDTINFYGTIGNPIPSISLPVSNTCVGTLTWTAYWDSTWLEITPTSGTQDQLVKFKINPEGLGVGSYMVQVRFESNAGNSPVFVLVRLHLANGGMPWLAVSDTLFDFGNLCPGDTVVDGFDIYNAGSGELPWRAGAVAPIILSADSGIAPSHVTFTVATTGLDFGQYILGISIGSPADPEAVKIVWVKFSVIDCGGCSFDIAEAEMPPGLPVGVQIYANGIQNVAGLEFHLAYNPAILTADSVTSIYMADPTIGFTTGKIHYVWDSLDGVFSVPDNGTIMTLWFTVIGMPGQMSPIEWDGASEIADPYGQVRTDLSFCPGSVTVLSMGQIVHGSVVYYDLVQPIPDVSVEVNGPVNGATNTDGQGLYEFGDMLPGSYQIFPYRFNDDSGVTVGDAVKIRRHLAYVEPFVSPFQLIAADVNVSKNVSIADVIVIRRYLALLDTLPSGNWHFVDSGYTITMGNWFDAPGYMWFDVTNADITLPPFIGVRMGDVNNSWGFTPPFAKPATGQYVTVAVGSMEAADGETIVVPITLADASDLAGFELHLGFDRRVLTCTGITSEILGNATVNTVSGGAHLVWEDINSPRQISAAQTVAEVTFQVTGHINGMTEIMVDRAEAVTSTGDPYALTVANGSLYNGSGSSRPTAYSLEQNVPNPFNPTTTIRATMAQPGEYTLAIFNIAGMKIREFRAYHEAGLVELQWDGRDDGGVTVPTGIYLYRFQSGAFSQTKQMVLLK